MAYEHNGLAAALELVNGLHYGCLVESVKCAGGLVEQDERRVVEEDARKADALALAARKRVAQLGNGRVESLRQTVDEGGKRSGAAGIEQLDRAIALQEKTMAEEDRIGFFLSDNLMHRMIFNIACRSTVWSWLEATNADLERFRWLRAATQRLDNQEIVNEHKKIRRAIAGRDPIEASFLVSKHLHMMFRNQTEVLDQYPKYFETSKLR